VEVEVTDDEAEEGEGVQVAGSPAAAAAADAAQQPRAPSPPPPPAPAVAPAAAPSPAAAAPAAAAAAAPALAPAAGGAPAPALAVAGALEGLELGNIEEQAAKVRRRRRRRRRPPGSAVETKAAGNTSSLRAGCKSTRLASSHPTPHPIPSHPPRSPGRCRRPPAASRAGSSRRWAPARTRPRARRWPRSAATSAAGAPRGGGLVAGTGCALVLASYSASRPNPLPAAGSSCRWANIDKTMAGEPAAEGGGDPSAQVRAAAAARARGLRPAPLRPAQAPHSRQCWDPSPPPCPHPMNHPPLVPAPLSPCLQAREPRDIGAALRASFKLAEDDVVVESFGCRLVQTYACAHNGLTAPMQVPTSGSGLWSCSWGAAAEGGEPLAAARPSTGRARAAPRATPFLLSCAPPR
jgi:hypothetical protein